jgi:hypothetical protein
MESPVRINLVASLVPTILGRACVPPSPGMMPNLIYGNPKLAFSEQSIISLINAI